MELVPPAKCLHRCVMRCGSGKPDLDKPVTGYLPDFVMLMLYKEITVRMLLNHSRLMGSGTLIVVFLMTLTLLTTILC